MRRLGSTRAESVDVQIIAASNEDLAAAARTRRFRSDLYHRLAVVTLTLPPLRERPEDVLLLAEHFLSRACADYGLVPPRRFAADARSALQEYRWPGNVRELSNVIESAVLLAEKSTITAAMLRLPPRSRRAGCSRWIKTLRRPSRKTWSASSSWVRSTIPTGTSAWRRYGSESHATGFATGSKSIGLRRRSIPGPFWSTPRAAHRGGGQPPRSTRRPPPQARLAVGATAPGATESRAPARSDSRTAAGPSAGPHRDRRQDPQLRRLRPGTRCDDDRWRLRPRADRKRSQQRCSRGSRHPERCRAGSAGRLTGSRRQDRGSRRAVDGGSGRWPRTDQPRGQARDRNHPCRAQRCRPSQQHRHQRGRRAVPGTTLRARARRPRAKAARDRFTASPVRSAPASGSGGEPSRSSWADSVN